MDAAELKIQIFRKVDSLDKNKLREFYGVLMNYLNGQKDLNDWNELSDAQKEGLLDAIDEIDNGKGILHEDIIAKYRKKYSNA